MQLRKEKINLITVSNFCLALTIDTNPCAYEQTSGEQFTDCNGIELKMANILHIVAEFLCRGACQIE